MVLTLNIEKSQFLAVIIKILTLQFEHELIKDLSLITSTSFHSGDLPIGGIYIISNISKQHKIKVNNF